MSTEPLTELLRRFGEGDRTSLAPVITSLMPELRRIAHRLASRNGADTLQTTALELYLRLAKASPEVRSRDHLLGLAARIMQQVLIDHARTQLRQHKAIRSAPRAGALCRRSHVR